MDLLEEEMTSTEKATPFGKRTYPSFLLGAFARWAKIPLGTFVVLHIVYSTVSNTDASRKFLEKYFVAEGNELERLDTKTVASQQVLGFGGWWAADKLLR